MNSPLVRGDFFCVFIRWDVMSSGVWELCQEGGGICWLKDFASRWQAFYRDMRPSGCTVISSVNSWCESTARS